jgi:hypothetical protein
MVDPYSLQTPILFAHMKGIEVFCTQNSGFYKIVQMAQLSL